MKMQAKLENPSLLFFCLPFIGVASQQIEKEIEHFLKIK